MTNARMGNTEIIEAFDCWQATRGWSQNTLRRRRTSLQSLSRWISPVALIDADADQIEEWLSTFPGVATRHGYLSDMSRFYGWAVKRRLRTDNPADAIDGIKVPKGLPRPVDAKLIRALVASAPDFDTRLMVALAAYAGLRRSEIANLCVEDIVIGASSYLVVREGKGRKDRIVPLHPALQRLLVARKRRVGRVIGLSASTIGERLAAHLRSQGINATGHQLRHTFATEFARASGGNVLAVAALLGHGSVETSMIYVRWAQATDGALVAGLYPDAA